MTQAQFPDASGSVSAGLGLSSAEAAQRLTRFGYNELTSAKPRTIWAMAWDTVREPMFLLLLSCSVLYLILGDFSEALLLSTAILIVMLISFVQERRAERTLDALRDLSSPRALVVRDGVSVRIAGKDVVPDDVVLINEGDRVPADGYVIASKALKIDESLLTGESVPVGKVEWRGSDPLSAVAGGDDTPFVYSGTLVVQGSGSFKVHTTGAATAIGRIGTSIAQTVRPPSALQQETKRVVRAVALASVALSVGIAAFWWLRDDGILHSILMGLTFAMGTIPEEFPVVLTVFMAVGAWRISKQRVLTRQMNAIEALGSATFLCVDKTGTLTENRMGVAVVWTDAGDAIVSVHGVVANGVPGDIATVLEVTARASDPAASDPMDVAAIAMGRRVHPTLFDDVTLEKSFPLVRPLLAVGYGWTTKNLDQGCVVAAKGAPEAIMTLCRTLTPTQRERIAAAAHRMATQGYRVLGVAQADHASRGLDDGLAQVALTFVGLVGFSDPIRAGVVDAVALCRKAGIHVMMITGDYPATAVSIARDIGLDNVADVLTGDAVASMPDAMLVERLKRVRVLARMVPEQKLRVVNALRQAGEVVAMTGDGVNDAPALKASHIGIAMGSRGTDVAREAAALVLLDDNFTSIVGAIHLGRRIYDNIQKAISYIIAIHIPMIGLTLVPLVLGIPPILWPVHVAFLELIIDPVCSIAFEAEPGEATLMQRPPRPAQGRLFGRAVVTAGLMEGVFVLIGVCIVYFTAMKMGETTDHARALAFATLIFANIGLILTLRSHTEPAWTFLKRPNPTLLWIGVALFALSGIVLYVPAAVSIFHFAQPHGTDLAISAGAAALSLAGFEAAKALKLRRQRA